MRWQDFITVTPGIRSGKPCLKGTRVTVGDVLGFYASGMTEAQILIDFPYITAEHLKAALTFAAEREQRQADSRAA